MEYLEWLEGWVESWESTKLGGVDAREVERIVEATAREIAELDAYLRARLDRA